MPEQPALLVFVGGPVESAGERWVRDAQRACALDTLERAGASGVFGPRFLVTDRPEPTPLPGVQVEPTGDPFHFGRCLRELVARHRLERILVLGGGGLPLLPMADLAAAARRLTAEDGLLVANNPFSCDLIGLAPASALARIELPATDNPLARLLRQQAGLREVVLARSAATQLDIDTPTDLRILAQHPATSGRLRQVLDLLPLETTDLLAAAPLFTQREAQVLVAGRVSRALWEYLETQTACRVRVLAEERGMVADGREVAGAARSALGFLLEAVGTARFFAQLAELGDAAFLDTRVLFAHRRMRPTRADRFASDLGRVDAIRDPWLREFTAAARAAPIPVILGGHSLVAGGLWALVEAAWARWEQAGGRRPR